MQVVVLECFHKLLYVFIEEKDIPCVILRRDFIAVNNSVPLVMGTEPLQPGAVVNVGNCSAEAFSQ